LHVPKAAKSWRELGNERAGDAQEIVPRLADGDEPGGGDDIRHRGELTDAELQHEDTAGLQQLPRPERNGPVTIEAVGCSRRPARR